VKLLFLAIPFLVSLTGCMASLQEIRQDGPLESDTSTKSVDDLAKCTLFAWQASSFAGAHYQVFLMPREGGGLSVVNDFNREFTDFHSEGDHTRVDFYSSIGRPSYVTDRRYQSVRDCL